MISAEGVTLAAETLLNREEGAVNLEEEEVEVVVVKVA